jgi:hypothetical protein
VVAAMLSAAVLTVTILYCLLMLTVRKTLILADLQWSLLKLACPIDANDLGPKRMQRSPWKTSQIIPIICPRPTKPRTTKPRPRRVTATTTTMFSAHEPPYPRSYSILIRGHQRRRPARRLR